MPKHIVDLLTTLGVPADEAAKIDSLPEADQATFDSKPYVDKVKQNYQTQLQHDPAFYNDLTVEKLPPEVKKRIEGASFGRAANVVKDKLLKHLGMTEADLADLPEEQKDKIETLIPIITERWSKTKSGDKQLQADLIEARKKLEAFGPDYEKGIETKYQTQADQRVVSAIFNANLIGALSEIPGLKIPAADIAIAAANEINKRYGFEKVGDFSIELRQKANNQLKALKKDSSQEMTLKEAVTEIAIERGWAEKQDDKDQKRITGTVKPDNNGVLKLAVAPHLQDKIKKKIDAEANM